VNDTTTIMPTRTRQVDGLTIRYADTDAASGAHGDLVLPSNGRYLVQRLPDSRLSILDTGHFAGSRSDQYAAIVAEWVAHRGTRSAGMKGSTDHE
jgi:hypothetical protein